MVGKFHLLLARACDKAPTHTVRPLRTESAEGRRMRRLVRTGSLSGVVVYLVLAYAAVEAKNPPPPPACVVTSVEATYPKIVQSGVPEQLQVTLLNGTSRVDCDKPIDIKTTDRA